MKIKMLFPRLVKYNGEFIDAYNQFDVDPQDVEEIKAAGGWVVDDTPERETVKTDETATETNSGEDNKEETQNTDYLDNLTLEELRDKAVELGIEYKGNWGVKKLTEEIKEVLGA